MDDTTPRARLSVSFWVLVAGSIVYFVAQGMLFPVLPKYIKHELGGGKFDIAFTVSSFAIGAMVARPLGGMFADRLGRRVVTIVGSLFWSLMVGLYPVAGTHGGIAALVAARILGGLGGGILFVAMAAIATDLSPPDRRIQGFGLFSSSTLIGFAIGPPLGLAVLDDRHYGRTFTLCAAIAVAPAIAMVFMPDTRPARHSTARPAIRSTLFHPAARRHGLALLLGGLSYVTFAAFLPDYADEVHLERVGIALTLNPLANLVVRLVAARFVDRVERRLVAGVSLLFIVAAALTLALWAAPAGIFTAAVLNGAGNAYLFPSFLAMTVDRVDDGERALAIGSLTVYNDIAISGGGALLGIVASTVNYRGAFAAAAGLAACSFVITMFSGREAVPAVETAIAQ
ncbi:MAG: MFS transporter [Actinobacteria bacterium]|nr:MAG: MFS transporter [Actinomycetota bacterium]